MPMSAGGNALGHRNAAPFVTVGLLACWCCALVLSAALIYSLARASDFMEPRLYEVVTSTSMPHLEENLRYTTTRGQRCLGRDDFLTAFPALSHPALKGCVLGNGTREGDDTLHFELLCEGGHGTTGIAAWRVRENHISGVLRVKLGGKNLTFFQRIDGTPVGDCSV